MFGFDLEFKLIFQNSGAYMEKRFAGPKAILIQGLMSGTLDISTNEWAQQVTFSPYSTLPI